MLFLLALVHVSCAYDHFDIRSLYSYRRVYTDRTNYNQTFFSSLESYQVGATPVSESKYPWIARVVQTRTGDYPHLCTASCVHHGVFVTAARCIIGLTVRFTSVIYNAQHFPVRAFVIPTNASKQSFDDVGFIVLQRNNVVWRTVTLFKDTNRTDGLFKWFDKLPPAEYKVVGYAADKGVHKIEEVKPSYRLTELSVAIGLDLCSELLTVDHQNVKGFMVPCYHSCTIQEFRKSSKACKNYHGVEGGAVIRVKSGDLLGVATWGPYFKNYELPVGLSVVNSDNFFQDFECAKKIWADNLEKIGRGYYQKLCDNNNYV